MNKQEKLQYIVGKLTDEEKSPYMTLALLTETLKYFEEGVIDNIIQGYDEMTENEPES